MWHTITLIPCMTFIRYSRVGENKKSNSCMQKLKVWFDLSLHNEPTLSNRMIRPDFILLYKFTKGVSDIDVIQSGRNCKFLSDKS